MSNSEIFELPDPEGNQYMLIGFGYARFVVPFDEGVIIMKAMKEAESFERSPDRITPINKDNMEMRPLSRDEYVRLKMHQLIGAKDKEET